MGRGRERGPGQDVGRKDAADVRIVATMDVEQGSPSGTPWVCTAGWPREGLRWPYTSSSFVCPGRHLGSLSPDGGEGPNPTARDQGGGEVSQRGEQRQDSWGESTNTNRSRCLPVGTPLPRPTRSAGVAHRDRAVLLCRGSSIPPHQDRTGICTGPSLSSSDVQVARPQLVQQPSLAAIPPSRRATSYCYFTMPLCGSAPPAFPLTTLNTSNHDLY